MSLQGGCRCGAIRYRVDGEAYHSTICHCTECRASSGAPLVAWATVRGDAFRITRGEPRSWLSDRGDDRGFCPHCGTQLTFRSRDLGGVEVDFTLGSLDDPDLLVPVDEVWTRSRLAWIPPITSGSRYERGRAP